MCEATRLVLVRYNHASIEILRLPVRIRLYHHGTWADDDTKLVETLLPCLALLVFQRHHNFFRRFFKTEVRVQFVPKQAAEPVGSPQQPEISRLTEPRWGRGQGMGRSQGRSRRQIRRDSHA